MDFLPLLLALVIVIATTCYFAVIKRNDKSKKESCESQDKKEDSSSSSAPKKKKSKPKHSASAAHKKTKVKGASAPKAKASSHARFKRKFGGHGSGNVLAMAISPNGEWLATFGDDGQLRIASTQDSNVFFRANMTNHDRITSFSWQADNRTMVCGFRDSVEVAFFRMRKKQGTDNNKNKFPYELVELVKRRFPVSGKLDSIAACINDQAHSSSLDLVFTSGRKGTNNCIAVAWDGKNGGNALGTAKISGERMRLSLDGNYLCGRGEGNSREVKIYEIHRKRVKDEPEPVLDKMTQKCLVSSNAKVLDIDFCGNVCDRAVACCLNGEIQAWDLNTSGQILKPMCATNLQKTFVCMAVSCDGSRVAVATDDASLHLLTFSSTPEPILSLDFSIEGAHTVGVGDIQFCPSGNVLYTRGLASKEVFAWNIE